MPDSIIMKRSLNIRALEKGKVYSVELRIHNLGFEPTYHLIGYVTKTIAKRLESAGVHNMESAQPTKKVKS